MIFNLPPKAPPEKDPGTVRQIEPPVVQELRKQIEELLWREQSLLKANQELEARLSSFDSTQHF